MIPPLFLKHKMHVRRSPTMSAQHCQELSHRPIVWDGIRNRHDCFKPKDPVLIASHHTSPIWAFQPSVLDIIMTRGISLPDIYLDIGDGIAGSVFDGTENQTRFARWIG
jgi:hypothetical protein